MRVSVCFIIVIFLASAQANKEAALSAAERASDFIRSKRDPVHLTWKTKASAAAVLALTSQNPVWRSGSSPGGQKNYLVEATANGVRIALLDLIARSSDLSSLDHSQLAQFLAVSRIFCDDPTHFHGHNLLEEAHRRLASNEIPALSPANAGLALALCIHGRQVSTGSPWKLAMREDRCSSHCVVRATLNILALSCMYHQEGGQHDTNLKRILGSNVRYLNNMDQTGYRPNLYKESLIIQANKESPYPLKNWDTDKSLKYLLDVQKPDGSFGGSVALTALVMPALTGYTGVDIKYVECFPDDAKAAAPRGKVILNYEIVEDFTRSQSLVGDFEAPRGGSLLEALEEFQRRSPEALNIEMLSSPFGSSIRSINEIEVKEKERLTWKIYKVNKDNEEELTPSQDPNKVFYNDGDTIVLKFQQSG